MGKIENILTSCITEIKSGEATLAECLERYSSRRRELEPLLKMVLSIQKPPVLNLDSNYKQVARARLLQQIRGSKQKKARPFTDIFSFGLPQQFVWARVAVSVLTVVILLSTLAGGTAYAAQSSIPGDLLYPVKIGTEDARLLIAGDSIAKAELNLKFANTRLIEMSKLSAKDEVKAGLAVSGYRYNLDAARQQIQRISDASSLSNLLDGALANIQNQVTFCDEVIDSSPKYIGPVGEASTLAINEQITLIEMCAQQNNLQAAQINFNAMQNRLQRAQDKASGNQYQLMQEVLLQYQQFNRLGEEILQRAQSANNRNIEVGALSLQALSSYLDTLNSIAQEIPQEYQNTIEVCRQMTLQFQTQARYGYQHQGDSVPGPQSQTHGNSGTSTTGQDGQTTPQYHGGDVTPGNGTSSSPTTPSSETGEKTGTGSASSDSTGAGAATGTDTSSIPNPSPGSGGSAESGSGTDSGSSTNSGDTSGGGTTSGGNSTTRTGGGQKPEPNQLSAG
ncbi:MAG: DUF5667 domain-containing protein [Dehalococcoidales bacterium]|nr:DUF5667 domain-containing protein [Dehalococcoidales bacterium]